jgi:hypothetical protein
MELGDLIQDERLALVALITRIVEANRQATDEESETVQRVAAELGVDVYRQLAAEADERFPDDASLRTFLQTIDRQEARELIYGTVLTAATGDVISDEEAEFLGWLARTWQLKVSVEPPVGT